MKSTKVMKLRLLLIVSLNSALATILFAVRGFSHALAAVLTIGIIVVVVGLIRK
jgi:hypothetical protein